MRTKDISIVFLLLGVAAFGYAKYREKTAPKSTLEACERGDTPSCRMYAGQAKQTGNIAEAKKYYRIACDRKDNHACHFLAALERQENANSLGEPTNADNSAGSAPLAQPTAPTEGCTDTATNGCSAPPAE